MDTVKKVSNDTIAITFTPSLVRGQGYYTGTIFEVEAKGYSGAVAGGGRYDNLIGKFLNEDIPAVGFSRSSMILILLPMPWFTQNLSVTNIWFLYLPVQRNSESS